MKNWTHTKKRHCKKNHPQSSDINTFDKKISHFRLFNKINSSVKPREKKSNAILSLGSTIMAINLKLWNLMVSIKMIFLNYLINYIYIYFILFACILLPLHEAFKFPHISISSMRNNFELFDIKKKNKINFISIPASLKFSLYRWTQYFN